MKIVRIKTLGEKIYQEHLEILKKLNDTHIIVSALIPAIESYEEVFDPEEEGDEEFEVPSKEKQKTAVSYRNSKEMLNLLTRYKNREIYEVFLARIVSSFEDYLSKCLTFFFQEYPGKLTIDVPGVKSIKTVDVETIVESGNYNEIVNKTIKRNLESIFYAEPRKYIDYFEKVLSISFTDDMKLEFCEIKATRDIITHNDSRINDLYLRKSSALARGKDGTKIPIDKAYFESCISTLKALTGQIRKQVNEKHPIKK